VSPLATLCGCGNRVPAGQSCPCRRDQHRRTGANRDLGRTSTHWRRLSAWARHNARGVCSDCGGVEHAGDLGSKLTVDLVGGGDHSTARPEDIRVRCRRCHGARDGGRRVA
jgi:hypothetical protein